VPCFLRAYRRWETKLGCILEAIITARDQKSVSSLESASENNPPQIPSQKSSGGRRVVLRLPLDNFFNSVPFRSTPRPAKSFASSPPSCCRERRSAIILASSNVVHMPNYRANLVQYRKVTPPTTASLPYHPNKPPRFRYQAVVEIVECTFASAQKHPLDILLDI